MIIRSLNNPTLKAARALKHRKAREESGLFWVEGIRAVGEAIEFAAPIAHLIVAPDLLISDFARRLVAQALEQRLSVLEVTPEVFHSLANKEHPQGIGAVIRQTWHTLHKLPVDTRHWCYVALDSPQDPGNIGTILRTCDAVGASGIILLGPSADPYDPSAVRASMGTLFSMKLVRASFVEFWNWCRAKHIAVIGTSDKAGLDYTEARYAAPLVLLMGSEREGLSADNQARCDVMVRLPMHGRADSLNLAVATGVMLYELLRHRRVATPDAEG
ncbi:MAG: RNA methyltransferase [Anaerolineae bacterium]